MRMGLTLLGTGTCQEPCRAQGLCDSKSARRQRDICNGSLTSGIGRDLSPAREQAKEQKNKCVREKSRQSPAQATALASSTGSRDGSSGPSSFL